MKARPSSKEIFDFWCKNMSIFHIWTYMWIPYGWYILFAYVCVMCELYRASPVICASYLRDVNACLVCINLIGGDYLKESFFLFWAVPKKFGIHTYIHTYIHTHTHTYVHTYMHTDTQWTPSYSRDANACLLCSIFIVGRGLIFLLLKVICKKIWHSLRGRLRLFAIFFVSGSERGNFRGRSESEETKGEKENGVALTWCFLNFQSVKCNGL